MDLIDRMLQIQDEKQAFLTDYLQMNEMINQAAKTANTFDLQSLNGKKRKLVEATNILDNRLLDAINELKGALGVKDLGQADTVLYPELKDLKRKAGDVLKLMVEVKRSDDSLKVAIDRAFAHLKGSRRPMDLNRMYVYTQDYFNEGEKEE